MPEWLQVTALIIGALGGLSGVAALGTLVIGWRKAKPDIARLYEEMATKQAGQIADMRCEMDKQGERLRSMRMTMREWLKGIKALIQQVIDLDQVPAWVPQDCEDLENEDGEGG